MKKCLFTMALVALLPVAMVSTLSEAIPAKAAITHTTPVKMRGTWYGYSRDYKFWEKIHLTKYTFTYQSGNDKVTLHHIDNVHGKTEGKYTYTFQQHKHIAATDFYAWGKAKVKGKYKKCLVQDGTTAMFRTKIKHYSSVKY
ncbi:hypothetical protein [Levilactobacillus wangkuiensis]|uniref:hypothetical protein n=1 Tax=Levilactobacillus wangkuiensis TaxID=2799566 RepID=UPI0019427A52|nr:hypothetical protein [Levilactobacillus wangkuiensis]